MLGLSLLALAFAFLNRARGSNLFNQATSTTVSRIVATLGMAVLTMLASDPGSSDPRVLLLWVWLTLYVAFLPGWGEYVGFAIGTRTMCPVEEFAPVDWVMRRLPIRNTRIYGTVAMGLRLTLFAPCAAGAAYLTEGSCWWALATPLMGSVYLPCGWLFGAKGWHYGEYCAGVVLGVIMYSSIG